MKILRKLYNGTNIALLHMPAPLRRASLSLVSRLPFSLGTSGTLEKSEELVTAGVSEIFFPLPSCNRLGSCSRRAR